MGLSDGRQVITINTTQTCETALQLGTEFVSAQTGRSVTGPVVIIVRGNNMEAFDGVCMSKLTQAIQNEVQGSVVSLFSAEADGNRAMPKTVAVSRRLLQANNVLKTRATTVSYPGVQYTTPIIGFGIFVGFFLIFWVYLMAFCIMGVSTPQRFSDKMLTIAKES